MTASLLRELARVGPAGYVILGAAFVTCVLGAVAAARRGPLARAASLAALAGFAALLLTAWATVHGARDRFVFELFQPPPSHALFSWPARHLAIALVAESAFSLSAIVLGPLVTVAVVRNASHRSSSAVRWIFAAAFVCPVVLTAYALRLEERAVFEAGFTDGDARWRYDATLAASAVLERMRPWIVLACAAGAAASVVARARSRQPVLVRSRAGMLAVGIAGAAVYAAARPCAYDAAHPLPFDDADLWIDEKTVPPPAPTWASCAPLAAPVLALRAGGGFAVNGLETPDPKATLAANKGLWLKLFPGRVFPEVVAIAAPADAPASDVMRAIAMAKDAGFQRPVAVVVRRPEAVRSRTRGEVSRRARICTVPVVESHDGTWGEHVMRR